MEQAQASLETDLPKPGPARDRPVYLTVHWHWQNREPRYRFIQLTMESLFHRGDIEI